MSTTPSKPGSELAKFDPEQSTFPVLFAEGEGSVAEVIEDNFGDEGFSPADLDRVKIPAGGGTTWEVPDEEPSRTLEGIVIHKQPTRSFWFKARGQDGEDDGPPDCYSPDAKAGIGAFGPGSADNPTGACSSCPMNVFGSSDRGSGEGKACKEQMQVFLLQQGAVLPIQVSLPPTSLRPWKQYMTRLAGKGKSYYAVVTRLALKATKSNGQTYSVVEPSRVLELDLAPEEAAAAKAYGGTIRGFLEQVAADRAAAGSDYDRGDVPGEATEAAPAEPAAAG